MALTPIEVQQKTFATALRGYDLDEVDDFLDQVVTSLNDYEQRLSDAKERIAALEAEVANRGDDESAISRALVTAQRSADRLVADAEADASRIVADAESEAARLREQAATEAARVTEEMRIQTEALEMEKRAQRSRLEAEIGAMRQGVADLRERLRSLVRDMEDDVAEMETAIEGVSTTSSEPGQQTLGALDEPAPTLPGPGPVPAGAAMPEVAEPHGGGPSEHTETAQTWSAEPTPEPAAPGSPTTEAAPRASVEQASVEEDDDAGEAPPDSVNRAEEQLVAEMSADVEDVDDDAEEPEPAPTSFDDSELADDGEYERVRRPWESD